MIRSSHIFLSYPGGSLDDSEHAIRLGELLEIYGLRTWIAELDSPPQGDRHEAVRQSVESSGAFIACLGTRRAGRWGRSEIETASERAEEDDSFLVLTVLLPGSDGNLVSDLPRSFQEGPVLDMRTGVVIGTVAPLVAILWRELDHPRAALLDVIVRALRNDFQAVVLTGPPGSGKSALSVVVASVVRDDFSGGQAIFRVDPERSIERMTTLAMRALHISDYGDDDRISGYRKHLSQGRYLVVFDGVEMADVTDLVPPSPSAALIVSRQPPQIREKHVVIEVPPLPPAERQEAEVSEAWVATQPGFRSDSPEGADLLAISQPVEALCSVIAARDVKPPLSIGLFGEWGAGKTFFINKMQAHIDALASASGKAASSAYCSSIKQIVFNAWHYADANLWASLASRVFEGLAGESTDSERLFATLASSRVQLEEAGAEQEIAQRRVARAQEEELRVKGELAEAKVKMSDLASAAVDILDEVEDPSPLLADLRAVLHLQPDDDFSLDAAKDLRSFKGAVTQLWRQSKLTSILCLVAPAAMLALVLFFPNAIALALTGIATAVLLLRFVTGPVKWILRAHAEALDRSETLRRQENARLESRLEQLRREEGEARHTQEEAKREVELAEQEIEEIKDGRRLFQFISERSRGDAYEPYLGLVALVRRDFERLAGLIEDHTEEHEDALPPLERIVLYIDDLDRCPADRVVEVLEAVHLLMASRLFVVVVAVDPRWLLSSLERHYAKEAPTNDESHWSPTPEDYLEKIFQIPFTLPTMEDDGFRRVIESSIETRQAQAPGESAHIQGGVSNPAAPASSSAATQLPLDAERHFEPPAIDLEPDGLLITPEEIAFMSKLGPVVRTPRSAKRLANLYRLARASLTNQQLSRLLGQGGQIPGYPALQLMLAIAIGCPSLCSPLLDRLSVGRSSESWWDLVNEWKPPSEPHAWNFLVESLEPLRSKALPDLGTFADLVPQVSRYSYGTLQLAAAT